MKIVNRYFPTISYLIFSVILCSCGQERLRIPLNENQCSFTMHLEEGERLNFWTNIDVRYSTDVHLWYDVEVNIKGVEGTQYLRLHGLSFDPIFKDELDDADDWYYEKHYDNAIGHYNADVEGDYQFRFNLMQSKQEGVEIRSAQVVVVE